MDEDTVRLECVRLATVGRAGWDARFIIKEAELLFQYIKNGKECCGAMDKLPNKISLTKK
jgi:hypothetical protein